jgi:polygalacturonase
MTIWTGAAGAMCGLLTAGPLLAGLARADHAFAASGCAKPPVSSLVVNVRYTGAKGDGQTDDTAALQAAFDKVGGTGGTVLVPDGTYMVDAVNNERRLKIRKDTTLKLSPGATIKAIPNGALNYSLLTIANVANVTVSGGTFEGDRAQHTDKAGEGGMGLMIGEGAKNVTISGVTSKEMASMSPQRRTSPSVRSSPITTGGRDCR